MRDGGIKDDFFERFAELNKEATFVRSLGDLYVALLRSSRRGEPHYLYDASESLLRLLDTIALNPETPVSQAVEAASKRVGWPEEPKTAKHEALTEIARAGITYLIEASGHSGGQLLTKRTNEFIRAIDAFQEDRRNRGR